uniref:Uncharacterized protein n=1 Tax=Haptolina ericina TaxID=156174 RepID=A0A7S3BM88_9EUKA
MKPGVHKCHWQSTTYQDYRSTLRLSPPGCAPSFHLNRCATIEQCLAHATVVTDFINKSITLCLFSATWPAMSLSSFSVAVVNPAAWAPESPIRSFEKMLN